MSHLIPPRWGSFVTNGRRVEYGDSYVIVDHAYVQFHSPREQPLDRLPLVFVHGGGLSGALWERTPDQRPGWAPSAARFGWPVFVLDGVDGGRSGTAPPSMRVGEREWKTARQIWTRYRIGLDADWPGPSRHRDLKFPVDHLDQLVATHVPRRRNTDETEMRAIVNAVQTVGRCHLIAHSHGAVLALGALASLDEHVERLVLVEPAPIAAVAPRQKPTLLVWGDYMATHDVWAAMEPIYRRSSATQLCLPDAGQTGNTHLPMCDYNSDAVFKRSLDWLSDGL